MTPCIFCKIVAQEIPATVVYESEDVLAFQDIHPKAPYHYLIIPKKHYDDLRAVPPVESALFASFMQAAQALSAQHANIDFRLVVSNGYSAGQRVFHSHIHFLAGKEMADL